MFPFSNTFLSLLTAAVQPVYIPVLLIFCDMAVEWNSCTVYLISKKRCLIEFHFRETMREGELSFQVLIGEPELLGLVYCDWF